MKRLLPFLAAALVVLAAGLAVALAGVARPDATVALNRDDRTDLAAPPVLRGPEGPAADPTVDLTDPEEVAHAYLVAAYSAVPEDAGRTNRRATAYAEPGSPPAMVGVLVLDPPTPGTRRDAAVPALELVAAADDDTRRAYLATLRTTDGVGGDAGLTVNVVLAHQPDGRWLITADTPENPDLD